eukprot:gene26291-biopygen15588
MNSCDEEGVRDRNLAGIEASIPARFRSRTPPRGIRHLDTVMVKLMFVKQLFNIINSHLIFVGWDRVKRVARCC